MASPDETFVMPPLPPRPAHVPADLVRPYAFAARGTTSTGLPRDQFAHIHEGPPVFWVDAMPFSVPGCWVPRRYAELQQVYMDTEHFTPKGTSGFAQMIGEITTAGMTLSTESKEAFARSCRGLFGFIKPIEGTMVINGKPVKKEFYQESEWRHIPSDHRIRGAMSIGDFEDMGIRDEQHRIIKEHCMLRFLPSDVKYIFVPTDAEIPAVVTFIQTELDSYPGADQKLLMSRVISLQSIRSDI